MKSVCLDLKSESDRSKQLALLPLADVVVESFRAGGMEKFGLGPEVPHLINPKLVIVRIFG